MAKVHPFRAYRYSPATGPIASLVTQPYDKISPEMQARYYNLHPKNLVRVILGRKEASDSETDNVYTRAGAAFRDWIADGTLVQDPAPAFYAYFQEFEIEDEPGVRHVRKGFIGLGDVVEYTDGVVFRHELTFPGPKKDRRQVLEATHAHFGQIFMLYADATLRIDGILDEAAAGVPTAEVLDEYGVRHRLWTIADPPRIEALRQGMWDKQLIIADGHHRYETALAFRKDHPEIRDASRVMMTFVNMHSPGLRILATHRVVHGLPAFDAADFLKEIHREFRVTRFASLKELRKQWQEPHATTVRIGALLAGDAHAYLLEMARNPGDLDVRILHERILKEHLGLDEAAVRGGSHIEYVRGMEAAARRLAGGAQAVFLLEPTTVEQVAEISLGGGVMPQKSTDFYPKMLTGMTIYRLES
jgi:uncharacterized protein (DUF1015 family)